MEKIKPYDYSGFSLKKLKDPRFSHILLLVCGWIAYFILYFITENLIPYENCHVVHSVLDDMIPFNEYFALFYVTWYAFVGLSLAFTFFFDVKNFKRIQLFIMITQAIAMTCYILYPTIQLLRPTVFPRDNFLTSVIQFIYSFDTPTGVCPSLHVGYSLGILSAVLKERKNPAWLKVLCGLYVIGVSLSVCFVKQHSIVDVFWAIPTGIVAEILVYGKSYWLPKFKKTK